MSITYKNLSKSTSEYGESGDCTVKALAIVAQAPYEQAHNFLRLQGRKSFNGLTTCQITRAFKLAGFTMTRVYTHAKTTMNLYGLHRDKTYVVITTRHIAAIVNGKVDDYSANTRQRIDGLYEITGEPSMDFLTTPEQVTLDSVKRKKRVGTVTYEMHLRVMEDGECVDVQVVNRYKRKPTAKIRKIHDTWLLRDKEGTRGNLYIYDVREGEYLPRANDNTDTDSGVKTITLASLMAKYGGINSPPLIAE